MKYATTFLKLLFGGQDKKHLPWQEIAIKKLQAMNRGYHPGRFINCLEVSMHAYKGILATQGDFFPNVTPLPNVPPYIPGYMRTLYQRMEVLDDTKKGMHIWGITYNYGQLMAYAQANQLPLYTHFIILTGLKMLDGGHALSGMIIPSDSPPGFTIFLYDAQGFLPDAWLHPDQFDTFYTIDSFFIYDSAHTQKSVRGFIEQCKNQATPNPQSSADFTAPLKSTNEIVNDIKVLRSRLHEFIKLEHFRLGAKLLLKELESLKDKINEYHALLGEFLKKVPDEQLYFSTAELFIRTEKLVKTHFHSYNWFNPQSLEHFKTFFEEDMKHKPFAGKYALDTFSHYLAQFLVHEIIRIGKENNSTIHPKISLLMAQLERVFPVKDVNQLADIFSETSKICTTSRTLTVFSPESRDLFTVYLEPLQEKLKEIAYHKTRTELT